ncbi:11176_t:CDS:2, partial [Racocetra persica]
AHYKKIFCEDRIYAFDTFLESGDPPELITIKDAIDFVATAWDKLDQNNESNITSEIQYLIERLPLDQPMSADEYVIADNNLITTEMPNDEEIIEAVKNRECIEPEEDEVTSKPISFMQALEFINGILLFLEQQPDGAFQVNESLIRNLGRLKKDINLKHTASSRQVTFDT